VEVEHKHEGPPLERDQLVARSSLRDTYWWSER